MRVYCVFVLKENIEPTKFERLKNKITFVNKKQHMYLPIGVLYVKSSLDKNGYITDITYYNNFIDKEQFISRLNNFNPEVVALSITSEQEYNIAQSLISRIKQENSAIKIIIGGPYSTLVPEDIMKNKFVDAVCIGEGEIAVPKYIEQVRKKEYKKTDNLYIRDNGQIIKCDKSVLIEDIDSVPYPDREGWLKLFKSNKEIIHQVLLERGCKYKCIYCSHHALSKKLEGTYLRYRKIENVIEEIKYMCKKYPEIREIKFNADNALADMEYFKELCDALNKFLTENNKKQELFFYALMNFTPNLLKDDCFIIDYLKKANIKSIAFGLESGSLKLRQKLHRPYYENEQFIKFCNKLVDNNITTMAFVMYCYPFETKETYKETINCLLKSNVDYVSYTWLTPFKGTLLYNETQKQYKDAPLIDKWRFLTFKFRLMSIYSKDIKKTILNFIRKNKNEKINNTNSRNVTLAKQALDRGDYKQAISHFNKIKIKEDNYWIYGDRAIAKMNIEDYKGAVEDFDKVLQLDPKEIYEQKKQECLKLLEKIN